MRRLGLGLGLGGRHLPILDGGTLAQNFPAWTQAMAGGLAVPGTIAQNFPAWTQATAGISGPPGGMVLWLRSDLGVTLSGSNVTGWADQSGNGNNAVGDSGTQFTYNTSDANWNSKPSMSVASGQFMHIADSAGLKITGALTLVALVRSTNVSGFNCLISKGVSSCEWDSYTVTNNTSLIRTSTAQASCTNITQNVATSVIMTTDQSSNQQIYFNGVSKTLNTNTFGAGHVSTNPVRLGLRQDSFTQLVGTCVEFIVYPFYLNSTQVGNLYTYQKNFFGLP